MVKKLIIAVDFDGTIVEDKFPEIGELKPSKLGLAGTFLEELKVLQEHGHRIILYTCREDTYLRQAIKFCQKQGLKFDTVNSNIGYVARRWKGAPPRKPFANIYIDDRALPLEDVHKDVLDFVWAL